MTNTNPYAEEVFFIKGMLLTFLIVCVIVTDILLGFAFSNQILHAWDAITYNITEGLAWIDQDLKQIEKGLGL
jgi:hypothetical protein